MILLGLTGGIGMGKSTTAKIFQTMGCGLFDADAAVHELYAKGGLAVPIIGARFPDVIIDGAINRKALSNHLRADPLQFKVLESFIHPLVAEMRAKAIEAAKKEGIKIMVLDIPLLYETKAENQVDKVVVVSAPYKIQRERVMVRKGMSTEKFTMIYAKQMADREKRKRADYIVETDKGLDFARAQVQNIITDLLQ